MSHSAGRATARRGDHFRPDLEGLRGIAVLLVVAFHAGPFGVTGGFIGVDVFFVISGFLITGLLLRERRTFGRIDVASFYARRVRRLLPAAAIVLVVTLVLSIWAVPPLDLPRVSVDGASAALSISNVRFAAAGGYFDSGADPSPFLHFWSLSVEEQFYLFWPLLLVVVTRLPWPRLGVTVLLLAVGGISLAACVWLTAISPEWAFYLLPTRAWELAAGGLLAVAGVGLARGGRLLGLLGWAGLAAVLVAAVVIDDQVPYPGVAALVPTLGTVALIASGDRRWGPGWVLRTTPMRFVGRTSYALYLWHWPLLVLPAIAAGQELEVPVRLALVGVAVVAATLSTLLIEEPIRGGLSWLAVRPTRVLGGGLAAILLIVALSATMAIVSRTGALDPGPDQPVAIAVPEPSDEPLDVLQPSGEDPLGGLPSEDPGDDPLLELPSEDPGDDPLLELPGGSPGASPVASPSLDPLAAPSASPGCLSTPTLEPTLAPIPTPSPVPSGASSSTIAPTPLPTPRPTRTAVPVATPGLTPMAAPCPPPDSSPTPQPGPTATPDPTPIPTPPATATPTPEPDATPTSTLIPDPTPTATSRPIATPAVVITPPPPPTPGPTPRPTPRPTPVSHELPRDVRPPLGRARDDEDRLRADGCLAFEDARAPRDCVYGDPGGRITVALVGDSHAAHWFPAFERVAKERGWRLLVFVKVSCPFTEMPLRNTLKKRDYPECTEYVRAVVDRLDRIRPDLVVTAQLRWFHPLRAADESPTLQGQAIGRTLARVPGAKAVIVDTPWSDRDIPGCLSRNQRDVRECAIARGMVTWGGVPDRERAAANTAGAALLDFTRVLCDRSSCPVVGDGIIRYRDDHHFTETFARSLAPMLDRALRRVLAGK